MILEGSLGVPNTSQHTDLRAQARPLNVRPPIWPQRPSRCCVEAAY